MSCTDTNYGEREACSSCDLRTDFLEDSSCSSPILSLLGERGANETLVSFLKQLIDSARGKSRIVDRKLEESYIQIATLNAQVDFLMTVVNGNEDTTTQVVNAARRLLIRGFQVLFPKVYCHDDVYSIIHVQGNGVNWPGFKELVHEHVTLVKDRTLPDGSRLVDRQQEILETYHTGLQEVPLSSSNVSSSLTAPAGSSDIRSSLSFLLPYCQARFATMDKIREESQKCLEQAFHGFPEQRSNSNLIGSIHDRLQCYKKKLKSLWSVNDRPKEEESRGTRHTQQCDDVFEKGVPSVAFTISIISELLDYLDKAHRTLEMPEIDSWVVQRTLMIINSDTVELVDDPFYGLSWWSDGKEFLKAMHRTQKVPLYTKQSHHEAVDSLGAILAKPFDSTAMAIQAASTRHPSRA